MNLDKFSIIVVAMDEEYKEARKRWKHNIIIKTGIGSSNVIKTLRKVPKWLPIINFGYVGSDKIPVNTEVSIGAVKTYHPNLDKYLLENDPYYYEPTYHLKTGGVMCFSSNDFVTKPLPFYSNVVFDMELATICALGFRHIKSIKIVSDNLNFDEFNDSIK